MLIVEAIVPWSEGLCLNKFSVIMSWIDIANAYQNAILLTMSLAILHHHREEKPIE